MNEQKRQKRQFWVIVTIVFLGFLGISMPYLIFPALFLNPAYTILPLSWGYGSQAIFLGITLAAYPLGQFVGSPILGALSDEYGRKKLLSLSLLVAAICNLVTGLAIDWQYLGLLILSRFFTGLMEGNIAIARAMGADLKTISKHETFGKINAAASVAFLIGPLLGGIMTDQKLWDKLSASTPFYCICFLFIGLAGLSAIILENDMGNLPLKVRSLWQHMNMYKRVSGLFSNQRLRYLMITSTAFTLAVDIFYEFGPVYLTLKWSLEPAELIYYNAILCLGLAIGNALLPSYFSSRFPKRTVVIISMGLLALLLIGFVIVNSSLLMMFICGLSGLLIGLAVTLVTVKISDSVSDTIQGEVMGVQMSLRVLGDAVICLLGGVLLLLSAKIILVFSAAMSLATMIYYAKNTPITPSR